LVNGRELTADDVVYSYLRECTVPQSYIVQAHPEFVKAIKMTATDKYSIDLVVPNDPDSIYQIAQIVVDWNGVIAKEVIDKYGDMKDWKLAHGTGPFILTDYVSGSAVTLVKNKDYWDKDPIGPGKGNKLPYVDSVKVLIITDLSSRLAALRTAKIDAITGIGVDDAKSVKQTTPKLSVFEIPAALAANQIFMRTDKTDLPYSNKKVRQALLKATDYKTIVDSLYGGKGVYPTLPCPPLPDLQDVVLPLSEASKEAQDLYVYDPVKAKQMLAEAGFPNGFKAQIFTQNAEANVDYLSIIKDMWSKVGIELTITPLELGVYNNRWVARNYDELFYGGMASPGTFRSMVSTQGAGGGYNLSYIADKRLADGKIQMMDLFSKGDDAGVAKLHRQLCGYIYEDAWAVSTPAQTSTSFWWPWMKNYHGETALGILNTWGWTKFVWIDSDMKKTLGY
jgi:peptide/nickel transport system substrate-binding protein